MKDCSKEFWVDKLKLHVFDVVTLEYIGKAIHEPNCPFYHEDNEELTEKCWKYVEYLK